MVGILERDTGEVYAQVALPNKMKEKLSGKQLFAIIDKVVELQRLYESGGSLYESKTSSEFAYLNPSVSELNSVTEIREDKNGHPVAVVRAFVFYIKNPRNGEIVDGDVIVFTPEATHENMCKILASDPDFLRLRKEAVKHDEMFFFGKQQSIFDLWPLQMRRKNRALISMEKQSRV